MKIKNRVISEKNLVFDVLEDIRKSAKNNWVFIHKDLLERLYSTHECIVYRRDMNIYHERVSYVFKSGWKNIRLVLSKMYSTDNIWYQVIHCNEVLSPKDPIELNFFYWRSKNET